MSKAQIQNYVVINMNELISKIDTYYMQYQNDKSLSDNFNLMNLNDEEINELIKNGIKLTLPMIEKIKTAPQLWQVINAEPVVGLVNFDDFQFPDNITFDNKIFTITKIMDEQTSFLRQLIYRFNYNNTFLQIKLTIIHISDDKDNIEYSYKSVRNGFINNLLLSSFPTYMVYKIPDNQIGSFSVSKRPNIYPDGRFCWIYKNTNIIVENNGIPEALFMQISHWLQHELENNVAY